MSLKSKLLPSIHGCVPIFLALLLAVACTGVVAAETHVIAPGETLYDIGLRYGVDPDALASANGISDPRFLQPGQQLVISGDSGAASTAGGSLSYVVVSGDTLSGIADIHGVSQSALVLANGLSDPDSLRVGQVLTIPSRSGSSSRSGSRWSLVWPAYGDITTYFGERGWLWKNGYHSGLDIGANYGAAIVAAEDGVAVEVDWHDGYGNYIKLDHGNGLQTLYGHLSSVQVEPWEEVKRGQIIGGVGSTGVSTGPHLHFEVRLGGEKEDPLLYLP